jgi:hypothetical protein
MYIIISILISILIGNIQYFIVYNYLGIALSLCVKISYDSCCGGKEHSGN